MSHHTSSRARWGRRGVELAVLAALATAVATARRMVLDRDQRAFDERYGARSTDADERR